MSSLRDEQAKVSTAALAILAAVAVAGVLFVTKSVMVPFVLAIFIASIVSPIVDLQVLRFHWPHAIAVLVALLFVLVVVVFFSLVMAYAGQQVISAAGSYMENTDQLLEGLNERLRKWLPHVNFADFGTRFAEFLNEQKKRFIDGLQTYVPQLLSHTFGTTVSLFTMIALVTIFVIFLLAGRDPRMVRQGIYAEIDQQIRSYISTKVMLSALTGVLVWIVLATLGLQLAAVFALLAFLLNFIPSVGSVIATVLPIPIAVAQFGGDIWRLIAVIAIPGAIQMAIGNGLEPKLMGNELKLHPVVILISLSFWGLLWGPIGMLLAIPIMASLRIVMLRFETTRPMAELLAGELPGDATRGSTSVEV